MRQVIIVAAIVAGVCAAYVLAHLALIEVGREVVVVHEPTPTGVARKARLWIVDDGPYSWIHPGNANAQWWIRHMEAHARVHQLLREKYGVADWWVRFLEGTDTRSGLLTWGERCKTVPIRLEPAVAAR